MGLRIVSLFNCILLMVLLSCQSTEKEKLAEVETHITYDEQQAVTSLLGHALTPQTLPQQVKDKRDSLLSIAKKRFEKEPNKEDNIIWYGRRLAYLSKFFEAINIYSRGIAAFPDSFRLLRHRGHRFISVRKFDLAIADLSRAAKLADGHPLRIEQDGLPNRLNKPLSNTHFNIWYHLGLAYYLKGDYQNARYSYETCLKYSDNDDLLCATVDWLYMTYGNLGERQKASQLLKIVNPDMQIIENDAYFKRLMMYKGILPPDTLLSSRINSSEENLELTMATQGYGVGQWYLMNGENQKALEIFRQVIAGKSWSSFGYIAAEVTLANVNQ